MAQDSAGHEPPGQIGRDAKCAIIRLRFRFSLIESLEAELLVISPAVMSAAAGETSHALAKG
ncbi:MAG: hypothetical protein QOD99_240, partial [Chthoniobacter sp.]|nr:hypothetical protein [Chthoniobacter sp.]